MADYALANAWQQARQRLALLESEPLVGTGGALPADHAVRGAVITGVNTA